MLKPPNDCFPKMQTCNFRVYEYKNIFILEGLFTPFSKLNEVLKKKKGVFIYCMQFLGSSEIGPVPFSVTDNKNDRGCSGV